MNSLRSSLTGLKSCLIELCVRQTQKYTLIFFDMAALPWHKILLLLTDLNFALELSKAL